MISLVTLEEAKAHLRIDYSDEAADADLQDKIFAASAAILDFIQGSRDLIVDKKGELIEGSEALARVKTATLIYVGILNRVRNGEEETQYRQGYLPFSVTTLIYSLRSPSFA